MVVFRCFIEVVHFPTDPYFSYNIDCVCIVSVVARLQCIDSFMMIRIIASIPQLQMQTQLASFNHQSFKLNFLEVNITSGILNTSPKLTLVTWPINSENPGLCKKLWSRLKRKNDLLY